MNKKYWTMAIIFLAIAIGAVAYFKTVNKTMTTQEATNKSNSQKICNDSGGTWLNKECTWIKASDKEKREKCQEIKGKFISCGTDPTDPWNDSCFGACIF
mgnify:FL=1